MSCMFYVLILIKFMLLLLLEVRERKKVIPFVEWRLLGDGGRAGLEVASGGQRGEGKALMN